MKAPLKNVTFFTLLICSFSSIQLISQDTIVKTNGERTAVKITEVGTNAVTYKKLDLTDGPNFIDYKTDIVYIRFSNGQKQFFAKELAVQTPIKGMIDTAQIRKDLSKNKEFANSSLPNKSSGKIEIIKNKYYINGERVGKKDVDRTLARSKNPMVQIAHKSARAMGTAQKIIGLTSIPSTIAGGIASWSSIFIMVKESLGTGTVNTGSYVNAGMSFLGTLSLPITNSILKNKRDKLYDKVIDLYNETN